MRNLIVGVHVARPNVQKLADGIVAAEQTGIQCAWLTRGGTAPASTISPRWTPFLTDGIDLSYDVGIRDIIRRWSSAQALDQLSHARIHLRFHCQVCIRYECEPKYKASHNRVRPGIVHLERERRDGIIPEYVVKSEQQGLMSTLVELT
jgi:hypothetical protein